MPLLTTTKTYLDGNILLETDLDNLKNSWETFFNVTKLDNVNFQAGGLTGSNFANGTIGSNQLASGCGTSTTLGTNSVSARKKSAVNYAVANVIQSFNVTGAVSNYSTQIGATLALTCSGTRPVLLTMIPYEGGKVAGNLVEIDSSFHVNMTAISSSEATIHFMWNGSGVPGAGLSGNRQFYFGVDGNSNCIVDFPLSVCKTICFPAAGLQGFALWMDMSIGGGQTNFVNVNGRLLALEL